MSYRYALALALPALLHVVCFMANGVMAETRPYGNTLLIHDDFYENPVTVREFAMAQDFPIHGNYPGRRTASHIPPGIKERFEEILDAKVTYWPDGYNGAFQYTLGNETSWIHSDATYWSGIVYLTPDAPSSSGTWLYKHKATGLEFRPTPEDAVRLGYESQDALQKVTDGDSQKWDAWEKTEQVSNKVCRHFLCPSAKGLKYILC